ncbi:MAG: hypothetical protein ACRD0D_09005, partial [Acidimicrobiales bacterium]
GQVLAGRYRLERATGPPSGPAQDWEARDLVLERPVTVVVLGAGASASARQRFHAGAGAASRLNHPNVVATFDAGQDGETAYMVTERGGDGTLAQRLASGPLPPAAAVAMSAPLAAAFDRARDVGLVHEPLDTGIVHLSDEGPGGRGVKVRFRVATAELGDGARDDGAGDARDLAGVVYEMLAGRPLRQGGAGAAPVGLRQLRAGIPRQVEAAVNRALGPGYPSAGALAADLARVDLDDDAVAYAAPAPTPPGGVAVAFARSERSWLVPAALIAAAGVVVALVGVLFTRSDLAQQLLDRVPSAQPAPSRLGVAGATSFDPEARPPSENEDAVALALDGDPGTSWATDRYTTRAFGSLKAGVGITLTLERTARLARLRVSSPSEGWSAAVYVAAAAGATLPDWGEPVATGPDIMGDGEFDLRGAPGGAVLLWLTQLGHDNRVRVAELVVEGS